MAGKASTAFAVLIWATAVVAGSTGSTGSAQLTPAGLFVAADACMACHNNMVTRTGEDVSIGADWRASMMANSARDPYWMAAVRREVMDHPGSAAAIEDECSICHMPMTTFAARAAGSKGRVFRHLPAGLSRDPDAGMAADGVSCTVCHQIQPSNLGTPASFSGGFVIDVTFPAGSRRLFGPFPVDDGRIRVMRSSSTYQPVQSTHLQQSELCATCHTLFTHALAAGAGTRRLPEQAPYLEWRQSSYRDTRSCQSCHMPEVEGEMALTQVLGQPRAGLSRHSFRGGNFFMMRMLNRYRTELGVRATAQEMDAAIGRTVKHLQEDTARLTIHRAERLGGTLEVDVDVENLAGHKLPTAYPSRRVWVELTVRDGAGRVVFESGALSPEGRIAGNDNDRDAGAFEPHHATISSADQVQVYESIIVDPADRVTTGLLTGVRYAKDNRLLPRGMRSGASPADVAVHGAAATDADFADGRDRVAYRVPLTGDPGPLSVTARLWYQPIGYRWAENLRAYDAPEPRRFVAYWDSMKSQSALVLTASTATVK
jgi:hypothetical protein